MSPLRILFLTADLDSQRHLAVDREYRQVKNRVEAQDPGWIHAVDYRPGASLDTLPGLLHRHRPEVVHFSGHGGEDGELLLDAESGQPGLMHPEGLAQIFGEFGGTVRLVVLSACYSDRLAKLLIEHVDVVIGFHDQVPDEAARAFSPPFYEALAARRSIASAFALAEGVLRARHLGADLLRIRVREGVDPRRMFVPDRRFADEQADQTRSTAADGGEASAAEIRAYLSWLDEDVTRQNQEVERHIPQVAKIGPDGDRVVASLDQSDDRPLTRIKRVIRLLGDAFGPETPLDARMAALDRSAKRVRRVVDVLVDSDKPLVLLGEPGTGKSVTLRECVRRLIDRGLRSREPTVIVYARLGLYRDPEVERPDSVLAFVESTIPPEHSRVRASLRQLAERGRLIVVFDGMDEMVRDGLYAQRIQALSDFARRYSEPKLRIKTLFACRINDFAKTFEHRRMVLMPFERAQIRQYLRARISFPVEVGGERFRTAHGLLRKLERTPAVANSLDNPLILFLTCLFIAAKHRLPSSRAELFDSHLVRLGDRLDRLRPGRERRASEREALIHDWAVVAHAITAGTGGTYVTRGVIERLLGERADAVIRDGRDCGLLATDAHASDAIRFTHHRYQEYLTAVHVSREPLGEIDWERVLDSPRWQETLIFLASIQPRHRAIDALGESLPASLPDEPETLQLVEDRILLASHIVGEVGGEGGLSPEFVEAFDDQVRLLATSERDTSRVKASWACGNVPGMRVPEELLRSDTAYVREQALALLAAGRRVEGSSFVSELMIDLGRRGFHRWLIPHLRAVWSSGGKGAGVLAWAVVCWLVYLAGLLACAGAVWLAGDLLISGPPKAMTFESVALGPHNELWAATTLGVLFAGFVLAARTGGPIWRATGMLAGLAVAALLLVENPFSFGVFHSVFIPMNIGIAVLMFYVIACGTVYLIHLLLYVAAATFISGEFRIWRRWRRQAGQFSDSHEAAVILVTLVWISAGSLMIGSESIMNWTSSADPVSDAIRTNAFFMICMAIAGVGMLVAKSMLIDKQGWRSVIPSAAMGLAIAALMGGLLLGAIWLMRSDAVLTTITWLVYLTLAAVLLTATLYILLRLFRLWRLQLPRSLPALRTALARTTPRGQAKLLRLATPAALTISTEQLLTFLRELDPAITRDPAKSALVAKILDLEEQLRQEREARLGDH